MKSAYLLSYDRDLVAKIRGSIRASGTDRWDGYEVVYEGPEAIQVRVSEADERFTLDDLGHDPDVAATYRTPPHVPAAGVTMPDLAKVVAYGASCRSEAHFAHLVRVIAETSGEPAWVLDQDDVVWDARNVDPDRVHL